MKNQSIKKLMDAFDLKIKLTPEKAKLLALENKLPVNAEVSGNLDLWGAEITSLPDGLVIKGNLDVSFSRLEKLPENLQVNKKLLMFGVLSVKSLPSDLVVHGDVLYRGELVGKKPKGVSGKLHQL